jgi:hypothetical protein
MLPVYESGVSSKVEWRCKMALLPGGMSSEEGRLSEAFQVESSFTYNNQRAW